MLKRRIWTRWSELDYCGFLLKHIYPRGISALLSAILQKERRWREREVEVLSLRYHLLSGWGEVWKSGSYWSHNHGVLLCDIGQHRDPFSTGNTRCFNNAEHSLSTRRFFFPHRSLGERAVHYFLISWHVLRSSEPHSLGIFNRVNIVPCET